MTRVLLALIGAALVALGGGAYWAGVSTERAKWREKEAAKLADARAVNARLLEATTKVTADVGAAHEQERERIRIVYRTLYREVPRVLTPEVDRDYPLPVGLIRLHDAAAAGAPLVPDAAGRADDAPSEVAASDLAGAVVDNYETAHQCRATVLAWQAWWREQSQAWASSR